MGPKTPEEKKEMSNVPYSNAIGSLMYATMCTRPNVYYAVGMVNCYQANLGMMHWKEIKRILRHPKGTKDYFLCYQGKELRLVGYLNVNWVGDLDIYIYIYICTCLIMVSSHGEARNKLV